jgi:hypothetical protein
VSRLLGLLAAAALAAAPFGVGGHIARSAESTVSDAPPPGSVVPPTLSVNFNPPVTATGSTANLSFVWSVGGSIVPGERLVVYAHPADEPAPPPGAWSRNIPITPDNTSGGVTFHGLTIGLGYDYRFVVVASTASEAITPPVSIWHLPGWVTATA